MNLTTTKIELCMKKKDYFHDLFNNSVMLDSAFRFYNSQSVLSTFSLHYLSFIFDINLTSG